MRRDVAMQPAMGPCGSNGTAGRSVTPGVTDGLRRRARKSESEVREGNERYQIRSSFLAEASRGYYTSTLRAVRLGQNRNKECTKTG